MSVRQEAVSVSSLRLRSADGIHELVICHDGRHSLFRLTDRQCAALFGDVVPIIQGRLT